MTKIASLKFIEDLVINPVHCIRLYVDPKSGKRIIAKVLSSSSPRTEQRDMLVKEYEIASSLIGESHVKPLAIEYQGLNPIVLYEDFSGVSVADMLAQGPLELNSFFKTSIALAEALENLHRQCIAHQDIKPSNIMVNLREGEFRYNDFSLAKKWTRQEERWIAGGQGSLKYLSPEQTGRIDAYIDYRTDFYSLGTTLYKMVCGRLPFESDDPAEIMHAQIARKPEAPHTVKKHIPEQLSAIILKMMEKSPSNRYKSAIGIAKDLSRCFTLWQENENVPLFPLGEEDRGGTLEISSHFYGREQEFERVLNITQETGRTTPLMIGVGALPGSGKTSFVMKLIDKLEINDGFFIKGKYIQYQRHKPLTAMITAFSQLFEQLYERRGERVKKWIQEVLGENLPAIIQLMPSLELLMGDQGKAVEVSPTDAQNRFVYNLSKIIELVSSEENPIVLFLDNLQWADTPSLNLLHSILTNKKCPGLIVIGTYRSSEVDPAHPLSQTLQNVQNEGGLVKEIIMGPLELQAVTRMISDTLQRSDEKTNSLASKIYVKSGGNPLLTEQLLLTLYDDEIINFDHEKQRWDWNEDDIAKVQVDVQVVDLVINKIDTLSEETRKMLFLATSFGDEIDLEILAKVMNLKNSELISHAEKALGLGLIDLSKKDDKYHLIFSHNRFREACYEIMPKEEAIQEQKRLGLALIDLWDEKTKQEHIFEITNLLNQSIPLLDIGEKMMLANYNYTASQKAIDSFAYEQGLEFVETGISLLSKNAWKKNYDLMLNFHENGLIAAGELKNDKKVHHFFDAVVKHAKTLLETRNSHEKMILYLYSLGQFEESVEMGRQFLKKLKFNFPKKGSKFLVLKQYLVSRFFYWWVIKRGKERTELTDPRIKTIIAIQEASTMSTYFMDVMLWTYSILKEYELFLRYGKDVRELQYSVGFFYLGRAVLKDTIAPRSMIDDVNMNEYTKFRFFPQLCLAYCGGLRHFTPLSNFVREAKQMFLNCLSMGDRTYSSFIFMNVCTHQFSSGAPILKCKSYIQEHEDFNKKVGNRVIEWVSVSMNGLYESLMHGEEYSVVIEDETRETDELFEWLSEQGMHDQHFHLSFLILTLQLINGNSELAWKYCKKGKPLRKSALATPFKEQFLLYEVIAAGLHYGKASKKEQRQMRNLCKDDLNELEYLMEQQHENYAYKYWLATAEFERMTGNLAKAHHDYRKGIMLAMEGRFFQDTAIGLERCGTMMLDIGDDILAKTYLQQSIEFYDRWGAKSKVSAMTQEHAELLSQDKEKLLFLSPELDTSSSTSKMSELIDTKAYMGAAEAISEEIHLENLIKVLVDVVMKNAGAEHVVLLTKKGADWFVSAEKKGGEKEVSFLKEKLKETSGRVPLTILAYVARSRKELVIKNAFKESEFTQDPYIAQHKTLSVLCLPLQYQHKMVATLYMENSLTDGAFTEERVQNILLLSSHIANALENAMLYEELKEYSKDLEKKVDERTKEIVEKNEELVTSNEALNSTLDELKKTQEQLVASEKLASLGELTAGIAHEIRNPLNFINNFSTVNIEMLEEGEKTFKSIVDQIGEIKKDKGSPEALKREEQNANVIEDIEVIIDNQKKIHTYGKRSEKIIALMEKHARVGRGTMQLTALPDLIKESIDAAKLSFKERHPEFSFAIEKDYAENAKELFLVQDEMAFVFYNVIKNAIEAMEEKTHKDKEYQPKLTIRTTRDGEVTKISIKDNGIGVEKEDLVKVFNPFYTSKPTGQAIGLALSICHTIITSIHHGTMTVDSEPGSFTDIEINLPLGKDTHVYPDTTPLPTEE